MVGSQELDKGAMKTTKGVTYLEAGFVYAPYVPISFDSPCIWARFEISPQPGDLVSIISEWRERDEAKSSSNIGLCISPYDFISKKAGILLTDGDQHEFKPMSTAHTYFEVIRGNA